MKNLLKKLFAKEESVQRTDNFNNYHWFVKNLKQKKTIFSKKFISTTDGKETTWQLGMYTGGSNSMTIHLTNFDDRDVSVKISLVIKNQLGKVVSERTTVKQEFAKKYRRRIYEARIKTDPMVALRNLSVFCEITIEDTSESSETGEKFEDFCGITNSDVIFKVDNRNFHAHQQVLTSQSAFFKAMFKDNMASHSVVEIRGLSTEVFLEFLQFLYTGEVRPTQSIAADLLEAAEKYGVSKLRDICQEIVYKNFMANNPHRFEFELACERDKKDFKLRAWNWLVMVSRNILNEPHMEKVFAESEPLLACEMYANRCIHLLQMNNCYNFY